jgi:SAM-dependent methyltransferase
VGYDPTIYQGAARHYVNGRPPYSAALADTLRAELGLDGHGMLVDVGCGPGIVANELAHLFDTVVGIDPDAGMLAVAARQAGLRGITNASWRQALAEELPTLGLRAPRLVTFAQSFHWTDQERVADAVYDLLEPGGSIALIAPEVEGRPVPPNPGFPTIPDAEVKTLVHRYLGPKQRAGQGFTPPPVERYEDVLPRSSSGRAVSWLPLVAATSCATSTVWSTATSRCPGRHRTSTAIAATSSRPSSGPCSWSMRPAASSGTGRATPTSSLPPSRRDSVGCPP